MNDMQRIKEDYPWIQTPVVVGAPMRLIALADMAVEISKAGGIGFIGAGTDVSDLDSHLSSAQTLLSALPSPLPTKPHTLPIGVGFINWGADLSAAMPLIQKYKPCAAWFFAPSSLSSLAAWTQQTRQASPATKIWVQVGSVQDAISAVSTADADVLVVQGTDAGGHGLAHGASLMSLLPEVHDALSVSAGVGPLLIAAGGIAESRSACAAVLLGADGVCLGTRFLACPEASIASGYQAEVLRATDGGQVTVRTKVYDHLRGTTGWAETHNARGIVNRSYFDAVGGMDVEENKRLYEAEMEKGDEGWGEHARMTAYAGTAVGLVREVKGAGDIVKEIREGVKVVLKGAKMML
ncbi:hypothetical protein BDU57DRAFT_531373 [Ampelomyces quisqualis]|uniref:Uncharacterized protein n=1 Tax=Ampelomyces quisqualis TaxID=50730 RepID=A0A6A5QJJ1_AMPQU|nr:hypothetical protein BDU57DRAFT_531373 [Ampelomyces quisqualis]